MRRWIVGVITLAVAECGVAQNLAQSFIHGAWSGQSAAVRSAIASGRIDVDLTTPSGDTALMLASLAGHEDVINILIEAGANPNLANKDGETALTLASKYGFTAIAAALIEAGADVNAQDSSGRTAWTWARWGDNGALVSLLEASGSDKSGKADPFHDGAPIERFETPPDLQKGKAPKISKDLRESGVSGKVILRLVIDRNGEPQSVELVEGLHDELDKEVLEHAHEWKFSPGEIQNKPVVGVVRASVDYPAAGKRDGHVMTWWARWRN